MFKEHKQLQSPPDDQTIWRYMDFTKFVDMLEKNCLYFTRADLFADPYEGTYPNHEHQWDFSEVVKESTAEKLRLLLPGEVAIVSNSASDSPKTKLIYSRAARIMRKTLFVNCWHANAGESAAMWQLYLANKNEGVAVRSAIGRFKESIQTCPQDVFISKVNYIDYRKEKISPRNAFYGCTHKRASFSHEKEVRALYWDGESCFGEGKEVREKNELRVCSKSLKPLVLGDVL